MNIFHKYIKQLIFFVILFVIIVIYSQWDENNSKGKIYGDYGIAKARIIRYERGVRGSSRLVYAYNVEDSTFYGSVRVTARFWDSSSPDIGQNQVVHYSCLDPNFKIIYLKQPWLDGMSEKICGATVLLPQENRNEPFEISKWASE